ncbi:MAG: hypothetical protein A2V64_04745 [Bacteroidetes bacterium RBG_13_43_22]|nr:MAG: hypothetical protein A2V64_04745 [Bacteroidetes bacterium RBG_13_43_22]
MEKKVKVLQITLSAMIILAFLMMPLSLNGQGGKANFAGTWAFNAEKSDMGGGPGGPPPGQGEGQPPQGARMRGFGGDFTATQEANLLTVERTINLPDGETVKTTSKYTLDGKESVNTTGRGESKSIATWSADGKTLKIATTRTFDMNGETRTMSSTEEWTLTDASTLSIKTSMSTPGGERVTEMVYNKK